MLDIPNEVKQLLRADGILKNIRISFPNGEYADICNDRLIRESLRFDESISSREEIKFGLCESSQLSFQCVDVENIKGMEIDATVEIDAASLVEKDMPKRRVQKPLIILATPEGEDEEKIFVVVDVPELQADGAEYTAQDGSDLYWTRQDMADAILIRNMNSAHRMTLSYYRNMTGVDPRGDYEDMYDGYHGGGYKRTYIYSVASQKFYPAHREAVSTHVPVSMRIDRGFKSNAFFDALNHVHFDSEKGQYVCPMGKYEYPIEAHKPIITRITDNENEYFVIITNVSEDNPTSTEVATDDGTEMMGCTFGSDDARYFTFDCTNITSAHAAGSIDFDYYRSATGHDPRGAITDDYDGYRGGGYGMTYIYSTATHKFYPCEVVDWEGSWREAYGYDIPFETMPLTYTFADGITNDEWVAKIGGVLFDDEQRVYYVGEDVDGIQSADDVPFPFYRIPLGRFIVDECKRDAAMKMRKVVAYSRFSSLPTSSWWTKKDWDATDGPAQYKDKTLDLNVMNFIIGSNNGMFDLSSFESSPISFRRLSSEGYAIDFNYHITSRITGNTYNIRFSIPNYDTYVYDAESVQPYKPWGSLSKIGRIDKYDISSSYESSVDYAIEQLKNHQEAGFAPITEDDVLDEIRRIIDIFVRFDPINEYKIYGEIYYTESYEPVEVGQAFTMPPQLAVFAEMHVGQYGSQSSYPITYLDSINDVAMSELDSEYDFTLKVTPEVVSRREGAASATYSFEKPMLFLDIRKGLEDCVELMGCFGRMGRDGNFQFLTLDEIIIDGLFPTHDVYPNNALFPTPYTPIPSEISGLAIIDDESVISLWYEEYRIKFGGLICTYMSSEILDENDNPTEAVYSLDWDNSEGLIKYDLSDNEIIKNNIWTAAEIQSIVDPLVQALRKIEFYPSDLQCVGLPYIEAGDWYLASSHGNRILGLILSRSMSGIQALRDKMKSD